MTILAGVEGLDKFKNDDLSTKFPQDLGLFELSTIYPPPRSAGRKPPKMLGHNLTRRRQVRIYTYGGFKLFAKVENGMRLMQYLLWSA